LAAVGKPTGLVCHTLAFMTASENIVARRASSDDVHRWHCWRGSWSGYSSRKAFAMLSATGLVR
jgi:hypothetical protein